VLLDAAGRMTRETNALGTFTYTYDGSSLRATSQTCPNGVATTRSYGTNLQDFYLQQITNHNGTTPISQFSYDYDPRRGLITSWSQQADTQTPSVYSLGYDDADQLKSATVAQGATTTQTFGYTYDPAGNRMSEQIGSSVTHLSYNALNELTASDAPGPATTYQYDSEHRLVKATSGTQTTELTYDGWGRCTAIVQSTSATPTSRRAFLWAGDQIAEEYAPDGTVSKRFFGQGEQRERVTIDSIRNHANRHFPVQQVARATYREILERRANENSIDFIEGVATAITPLAFLETVMVKGYQSLVDEGTTVSLRDAMEAALKLNEIARKDEGTMDRARILADMGRIIDVVRTFIPSERWPDVQAALRGETPASQQTSQAVEGVRMVAIDDTPDEEDD
jgi:YD repeat-containing protein